MNRCAWLLVCLLLGGCAGLDTSRIPVADTPHVVHVIYTGWHTSILVEAEPLLRHSPQLARDFSNQRYIRLGWGDGDYFTGRSKHWTTATKALVASGYSALQALAYDVDPFPQLAPETRIPLALTEPGLAGLAAYVERSIALDAGGQPQHLPPSRANDSLFYLASPRYGLFNNCNTWTSQALREAGLPMVSRLQLTSRSVFRQAQRISAHQEAQGAFDQRATPLEGL